jgi:hypothetical protein
VAIAQRASEFLLPTAHVLKTEVLHLGPNLVMALALHQIFDFLVFRRHAARTAPDRRKHLRAAIQSIGFIMTYTNDGRHRAMPTDVAVLCPQSLCDTVTSAGPSRG